MNDDNNEDNEEEEDEEDEEEAEYGVNDFTIVGESLTLIKFSLNALKAGLAIMTAVGDNYAACGEEQASVFTSLTVPTSSTIESSVAVDGVCETGSRIGLSIPQRSILTLIHTLIHSPLSCSRKAAAPSPSSPPTPIPHTLLIFYSFHETDGSVTFHVDHWIASVVDQSEALESAVTDFGASLYPPLDTVARSGLVILALAWQVVMV